MDHRRIQDQVTAIALTEAIHRREVDARFYRGRIGREWRDLRRDNLIALRELLRVRRLAMSIAAPLIERESRVLRFDAEGTLMPV
jgi:hypothetical protein